MEAPNFFTALLAFFISSCQENVKLD